MERSFRQTSWTTTNYNRCTNHNTENFTSEELHTCLKLVTNKKSSGLDNVPGKLWKSEIFSEELLNLCNRVYNDEMPEIWTNSCIVPLPKKGDLSQACNYRGISSTCTLAKIYNRLLLNRIRPRVQPILRNDQNGFRPNRSTNAQILTLRRITKGVKTNSLTAILVFVDFKKHSIPSTEIEKCLRFLEPMVFLK